MACGRWVHAALVTACLAGWAGGTSAAGPDAGRAGETKPAGGANPPSLTIESDHYRLLTDIDEDMAREILRRMEGIWEEYNRRLSEFRPNRDRADIRVYRHQADYQRYVGKDLAWSNGIYLGHKRALATFAEGKGFSELMNNLKHEGFH